MDPVQIEILDMGGEVIGTFVGKEPERKSDPGLPSWQRGGSSKPTTAAGLNQFTWDLRYPGATTFDGMIIWSGRPQRGPKAPPGKYQVRLTVGNYSQTYPFDLKMDPNLKGITEEDLKEQFDLAVKIRDKTSAANEAVIRIRDIRKQVKERLGATTDQAVHDNAKELLDRIGIIEEDLYQVRNQSNQDPLNFPIKLNNRLASLRRSVETGDARPTDGAYKVFGELSAELETQLTRLDDALDQGLTRLNSMLEERELGKIEDRTSR